MQVIDLDTWNRRDHFRLYDAMEYPYLGVTVDVEVTGLLTSLKESEVPVYPALIHAVATAANEIEAFRLRIRQNQVVRHERVHPSFTVPWRDELFNFVTTRYLSDRARFLPECMAAIAAAERSESLLLDEPGRDDMVFMTCLPWLAFSSVTHPVSPRNKDSIPRFAWGKIIRKEGREVLPFNLQLHHGLADGVHVARFLARLEAILRGMSERG